MDRQVVEVKKGNRLLVKYDGGMRYISEDEIRRMAKTDDVVEVR
jgi:hypothetical protein